MPRFNHAQTIAYSVVSNHEDGPTRAEALAGLLGRVADVLTAPPDEQDEILLSEAPFDTYEMDPE